MKQFATVLAATLVGALIALLLYDRLVLAPREQARAQAAQEAGEVSLARAQAQVQQISESLDASIDRSVEDARRGMSELADEEERRRLAVDALARASMVKTALVEFYQTNGDWPARAADAGLAAPEEFAGGGVAGVDVAAGGRIAIRLTDTLASGGRIELAPTVSASSGIVQWRCTLHRAADLARYLPVCRG